MPSWGNAGDNRNNQDMINWDPAVPDAQMARTLHVNDVNVANDAKIAIKAVNSSTNAAARALKVEGKAEIADLNADAVALISSNTHTGTSARAVYASGQVELVAGLTGNPAITAVKVYNPSTHSTARALAVTGDGGKAATISNETNDAGVLALEVNGNTTMQSLSTGNPAHVTLDVDNGSSHASARAIKAAGEVEIDAFATGNPASIGLHVKNASTHASALALKAEGTVELDGIRFDNGFVNTTGAELKLGTSSPTAGVDIGRQGHETHIDGDVINLWGPAVEVEGTIDSSPEGENQTLRLGTSENTIDVIISKAGDTTFIMGQLDVAQQLMIGPGVAAGQIDAVAGEGPVARDLQIGGQSSTEDLVIGRATKNVESAAAMMDFEGELRVGPTGSAGLIDSGGTAGTPKDMKIGSQTVTNNIEISRSGKSTTVKGSLTVDQTASVTGAATLSSTATILGAVKVGAVAGAGSLDANGNPTAQNLAIGGGSSTADVQLGRSGQKVDVFATERLNSNEVVVNGVANLANTASAGFVYNATGHGNGKSIDFYIDGSMRGYIDVLGWH